MGSISTPNSGKITEPAILYAIAPMANPCFACPYTLIVVGEGVGVCSFSRTGKSTLGVNVIIYHFLHRKCRKLYGICKYTKELLLFIFSPNAY